MLLQSNDSAGISSGVEDLWNGDFSDGDACEAQFRNAFLLGCGMPPTAIRRPPGRPRTRSTRPARRRAGTWRSGTACTTASAPSWPASRARRRSARWSPAASISAAPSGAPWEEAVPALVGAEKPMMVRQAMSEGLRLRVAQESAAATCSTG